VRLALIVGGLTVAGDGLRRRRVLAARFVWMVLPQKQPRSRGLLSASGRCPGCGWSRAYVYKSTPHRGWIFDLILSTLSMEVKVALPYRRYFES